MQYIFFFILHLFMSIIIYEAICTNLWFNDDESDDVDILKAQEFVHDTTLDGVTQKVIQCQKTYIQMKLNEHKNLVDKAISNWNTCHDDATERYREMYLREFSTWCHLHLDDRKVIKDYDFNVGKILTETLIQEGIQLRVIYSIRKKTILLNADKVVAIYDDEVKADI